MKAQWQIVDVKTGKTIKVEDEFELSAGCEEFFSKGEQWSYTEAKAMFGEVDAERNPIGIINSGIL